MIIVESDNLPEASHSSNPRRPVEKSDDDSDKSLIDATVVQKASTNDSRLRFLCGALHIMLILIHFGLLAVWLVHAEHTIAFSIGLQSVVSFLVTALATAFGTVYLALSLYITQRLALRRNLAMKQSLTAAHDTAASWSGIGCALVTLLNQIALPSSVIGTLSVAGYLLNISVLHITTPSLFSVQTFNKTVPTVVSTQGFPQINTTLDPKGGDTFMSINEVLDFLPWLHRRPTLGLANGSLYEVIDVDNGVGSSKVNPLASISVVGIYPQSTLATMFHGGSHPTPNRAIQCGC
ncbi:hypothetical protein MVEN_01961800 [Mycena venus]|uniref:Uncharacterized protein n=1 Tax=Mycena venus TaxID=2733690 RepID=A0A8H7CJW8_9AGAR|nr:hypothetical protein MVEN_01961800 [Mycena venus]